MRKSWTSVAPEPSSNRYENKPRERYDNGIGDRKYSRRVSIRNFVRYVSSYADEKEDTKRWGAKRKFVFNLVNHPYFSNFILGVILLNTLLITVQTIDDMNILYAYYFNMLDSIFLGIYIWELGLKIYAYRRYFTSTGWNIFDAIIVALSLFEPIAFSIFQSTASGGGSINSNIFRLVRVFKALKAVRALRVLRTISFFKSLHMILSTLISSIPAMGSIMVLLFLILYIFAIIGYEFYREVYPEKFGNLFYAMNSLFTIMTLDDWFEFYEAVRETDRANSMIIYLIVFIFLESFFMINLFIAVIVNNLEQAQARSESQKNADDIHNSETPEEDDLQNAALDDSILGSLDHHLVANDSDSENGLNVEGGETNNDEDSIPRKNSNAWADDSNSDQPTPMDKYASRLPASEVRRNSHILQLLAALDYNLYEYSTHQHTLDDLIDIQQKTSTNW